MKEEETVGREPTDVIVERDAGRRLRVRDVSGSTGACPVLYFHGTPESSLTVDYHVRGASPTSPRVFAIDRPGYGRSDFARFSFESIAQDAAAAADALKIDRFAVLGHSGGAPFALAAGAFLRDRVLAVGVSASPVPYGILPFAWDMLSEVDQRASKLRDTDLHAAAELFAVDFLPLAHRIRDLESARTYLRESLDADRAILDEPSVLQAFAASLAEGVAQGVLGCAWDNVAWVGSWSFGLDQVTQPVSLWYGENDELMPVTFGEWMVEELPQATLTVWPECGHLGLFPHWHDAFGWAAQAG